MQQFVDAVRTLVSVESPSEDPAAVQQAHDVLADLGTEILGVVPDRHAGGPGALSWHLGDPDDPRRVLLLGHVDTVWPVGTTARRPFAVENSRASGPGIFDMKAGLVVGMRALAALGADAPVSLLVTGDEEIGSAASRGLIEETARRSQACLVLEGAGPDGTVKSARKGWSLYTVDFRGVAAHAGLEPEKGVSVLPVLAELVMRVVELDDPASGVTVSPTTATAGTTVNTIPAHGRLAIDVRCATPEQQEHVDRALHRLAERAGGRVEVVLRGGVNRPPMTTSSTRALLERLDAVQTKRSEPVPADVAVGGISDANLTAAIGVPSLDGLGAVGGGAHAEHEWIDLPQTLDRVPMIAALVADLVDSPLECAVPDQKWSEG